MSVLLTVLTLHPYYSGCPTETWTQTFEHCKVGELGRDGQGGKGGIGGKNGKPYLGFGHVSSPLGERAVSGSDGRSGDPDFKPLHPSIAPGVRPNPFLPESAPGDPYDALIAEYADWYLAQARDPEKAALVEAFPGLP